jgi:hypothetical protein
MFYPVCIRLDSKIFKRIIYEKIKIAFSLYFEKYKKKRVNGYHKMFAIMH